MYFGRLTTGQHLHVESQGFACVMRDCIPTVNDDDGESSKHGVANSGEADGLYNSYSTYVLEHKALLILERIRSKVVIHRPAQSE